MGNRAVSRVGVIGLTITFAIFSVVLIALAATVWPPTLPENPPQPPVPVVLSLLGQTWSITRDQDLLLLVALLGALGAMAAVLRSFFMYAGSRRLVWNWVPSYFLIPLVGSLLATISYILLRAGLLGVSDSGEGNIWGFAAVATLVGLFNAQAATKLKDVFEVLFAPSRQGPESLPRPAITGVSPDRGAVGAAVTVTGEGLDSVTSVVFGGEISSPATFDAKAHVLLTTVPAGAQNGQLLVEVGNETLHSPDDFTVLP